MTTENNPPELRACPLNEEELIRLRNEGPHGSLIMAGNIIGRLLATIDSLRAPVPTAVCESEINWQVTAQVRLEEIERLQQEYTKLKSDNEDEIKKAEEYLTQNYFIEQFENNKKGLADLKSLSVEEQLQQITQQFLNWTRIYVHGANLVGLIAKCGELEKTKEQFVQVLIDHADWAANCMEGEGMPGFTIYEDIMCWAIDKLKELGVKYDPITGERLAIDSTMKGGDQ